MQKKLAQKNKVNKWIYWIPRMLGILFVLFLALFSLDVFESGLSFWSTLLALLIHNIPSIVLAIILAISWKYEIVGGITFILAGLLYILSMMHRIIENNFELSYLLSVAIISGIAFLIGILFLIGWFKKRK
jgi:hypothetical protein